MMTGRCRCHTCYGKPLLARQLGFRPHPAPLREQESHLLASPEPCQLNSSDADTVSARGRSAIASGYRIALPRQSAHTARSRILSTGYERSPSATIRARCSALATVPSDVASTWRTFAMSMGPDSTPACTSAICAISRSASSWLKGYYPASQCASFRAAHAHLYVIF